MKSNDMSNLVIQITQVSYESLGLILLQITFQKELFKLPSIFVHILGTLFEVMKFEIVIFEVMGGYEFGF